MISGVSDCRRIFSRIQVETLKYKPV